MSAVFVGSCVQCNHSSREKGRAGLLSWPFKIFSKAAESQWINNRQDWLYYEIVPFLKINFYWTVVDLQCCILFCSTAKWISIPISILFRFFSKEKNEEFPVLYSRSLLFIYFIYSEIVFLYIQHTKFRITEPQVVDGDPKIKVIHHLVGFLDIFSHLLCWLPSLVYLFLPDLGSGEIQSCHFSADQNTHPPIGNLTVAKLFYSQFRQWPCLIPLEWWLPLSGIIRPTLFLCIFQSCKERHNKTHNRQNENSLQNTHSYLCGMHGALWGDYSTEADGENEVRNSASQRCWMFGKIKTTLYPIYSGKGKWYYCCYQRASQKYRILWWGLFTYD